MTSLAIGSPGWPYHFKPRPLNLQWDPTNSSRPRRLSVHVNRNSNPMHDGALLG